eukprot:21162-Heterococcus_DN1.PRE.2
MIRCLTWCLLLLLLAVQAQLNCGGLKRLHFEVSTVQDAAELALAAARTGKVLTAIWYGALVLPEAFTVSSKTSLAITAIKSGKAAIIDGNSTTQLFIVNGNLTLTGITLQNGYANSQTAAGAINALASAFVVLQNCTLIGRKAVNGAAVVVDSKGTLQSDASQQLSSDPPEPTGSSIRAVGATVIVSSTVFELHEASSAVHASESTLTILNSTFRHNRAIEGAGISCNKNTTAYLTGCLFDSNLASRTAGAIVVFSQSQLIASDTNFTNNSAPQSGAVSIVVATSTTFTDCCAAHLEQYLDKLYNIYQQS